MAVPVLNPVPREDFIGAVKSMLEKTLEKVSFN